MHITFDKIDAFIRVCGNEFRHLALFDYGLLDEICENIRYLISVKKVILQIVLIITFKKSTLIHIILYLLKKYQLFM